jgi:hypothetical protein
MWIGRGQHGIWIVGALLVLVGLVLWSRHRRRIRCGTGD